jgi:hypothetical protein
MDAPVVRLEEEQIIQKKYPLDYHALVINLKNRYSNFTTTKRFYALKKDLTKNDRFCKIRYLDPIKKNGSKKVYYSLAILKEFDKHYTRKK